MAIFKNVFALFNHHKSAQQHKNSDAELDDLITKSVNDFKNRPILDVLTIEIINSTPEDELAQLVFDNLVTKLPADYRKELETVAAFTKLKQAIFIIWMLDAEVLNGGFNQYYYNSNGKYMHMLVPALNLIGASDYSALVGRANAIYKNEYNTITQYQDGTLKGFSSSYQNNPLTPLDGEFYELGQQKELSTIMAEFIRKNKESFVDE